MFRKEVTAAGLNEGGKQCLPGHLGIEIVEVKEGEITAELMVATSLMAPNGYLHAGSMVTLADTVAGYSTMAHLPEKAVSFTTIELKTNLLRTLREGRMIATSQVEHLGRTTQVWRVVVSDKATMKTMAIFSCTQLILY